MAVEFHLPKSIPWITEQSEPGVQARDLVDTRMDALAQMVEDAKADFDASIAAMNQTVTPITVGNMDIAVPVVGINVDPTSTKPDYADFTWQDGEVSTIDTTLVAKLATWLTNDESAIPADLLTAMYEAEEIRLDERRAEAAAKVASDIAARGFEMPAGMQAAQLAQIERQYDRDAVTLSSNLAAKNMELTQTHIEKAAELANAYIAAAGDYVVKKNEAATKLYVAAIDAWVSEYKALVEGASEDAKVQTQLYQVETTAEIEKQRILVTAQNANQTFAQSVLDSQSKLQAQMVASGLSGMHVQASISSSHGTGQDVGFRYSYSEGMDENHSESQTVKTSDS